MLQQHHDDEAPPRPVHLEGQPCARWPAIYTDEPDSVTCPDCKTALARPSTCLCGADVCACYGAGYAQGKEKAHYEIWAMALGTSHAAGCGCEPCKTTRTILTGAVMAAARDGLTGCGLTGGEVCGSQFGRRCPGWPDGAVTGGPADACPLATRGEDLDDMARAVVDAVAGDGGHQAIIHADALARAARRRWAENRLAQLEGRADVFGWDPEARLASWDGRYDGAV